MKRKNRIGAAAVCACAVLVAFAGCKKPEEGGDVTPPPGKETTLVPEVMTGNAEREAKMLQDMVNAGEIPNLEKRIPDAENVYVEALPSIEVGVYGEGASFATVNADSITGQLVSEGLFRYDAEGNVVPNIAKAYEVNADFTSYTIYLREGLRWSDGVPFTADDCVFFYEQMCVPQVFGEALWKCFIATTEAGYGARASFTKLDNYTFSVTFPASKPEFLTELIEQGGICFAPEHYYVNLLPKYMGEDAALAKAQDMGYADTEEMLRETVTKPWNFAGIPTLNPYCISAEDGKNDVTGNYYEFVRNPYYWKVDAEWKQLPYLDKLQFTRISGEEQKLLLTTEGYLTVSALTLEQVAEAQASEARGEYHLVVWDSVTYWAVNNKLRNFPESGSKEAGVRGLGAAHVEQWYFE